MKRFTIALFIAVTPTLFAQMSDTDVRARLELIHGGKIDQVRAELPSLQAQYPNDPGVAYLDAEVTENGSAAVKKYQTIVDNFPNSSWADDALYKVYQYYYAVGLYKTAEAKMAQLRVEYPSSIYVTGTGKESEPLAKETAPVPMESDTVNETVPAPAPQQTAPASVGSAFLVQVAVYSQEPAALQQSAVFSQTVGRQASVISKQSGGRTLYAVVFDGFQNEQEARTFGEELKSKFHLEWFIVKR